MKPNANWNTLNDKLNAAGLRGREQSPEFAARRFMIDLERPAIISADARIALSSGNEDFKLMLNNGMSFKVAHSDGTFSTMTLAELTPIINKHNVCVASMVFPESGAQANVYNVDANAADDVSSIFSPVENSPWGFTDGLIAWYDEVVNGQRVITALPLVPGYRLYGIKDRGEENELGIMLEDTSRAMVFVSLGEFNLILKYETKQDYLDDPNSRVTPDNYRFRDADYILIATEDDNFHVSNELRRVSAKDFVKMRDRQKEQGGLDAETSWIEDDLRISKPWVAYFSRTFHTSGKEIYLAFIGAPGYTFDHIEPAKVEGKKPALFVKDSEGELIHIYWLNFHDVLNYANRKAWENDPDRFNKRRNATANANRSRNTPYPGVGKGMLPKSDKPLVQTAARDAAKCDEDGDFDMGQLDGVKPIAAGK
jgi:hypothetical protein